MYNRLLKLRDPSVEDNQLIAYDAPHETKRKLQLERLFNRTKEQVHHIHTHVHMYCCNYGKCSLVLLIMLVHVISNIGLCLCVIVYYSYNCHGLMFLLFYKVIIISSLIAV